MYVYICTFTSVYAAYHGLQWMINSNRERLRSVRNLPGTNTVMLLPRTLFVLVLLLAIVFYAYQLLFYVSPVTTSLAHRALVSGPSVRGYKLTTFKRHLAFCERNAFLFDESTAEADFTGKRALSIVRLFHQSYVFDKYEKLRREGGLLHPPPSHGLDYMSEACRNDRRCWENMGSFKPSEGICNLSREGGTGDGSKLLCLGGGNKRVGYGPTSNIHIWHERTIVKSR